LPQTDHVGDRLRDVGVSMIILFLHGWKSIPGGVKPTYLKQHGHQVINPKLDDDNFALAMKTAQAEYDLHRPDVIVGSSRGGAIAMNIQSAKTPLVLLCPAWKNWGSTKTLKPNSMILHSRDDEVIPFEDSELLVVNSGLEAESLVEVGGDHRLADEASLSAMLWACNLLTSGELQSALAGNGSKRPLSTHNRQSRSQDDACYICDACGEEIVIPVDLCEGSSQSYVEDCPVCCRANIIHVDVDEAGHVRVWAEPEQDYD
jgi:Cysteine-rich CPXCG